MPFHVRITSKDPQRRHHDALALDKDAPWVEENIAAPRRQGRDIFVDGQVFSWDSIDQILITETVQISEQLIPQIRAQRKSKPGVLWIPDRWYVASDGTDVTEQFITGPPGADPDPEGSKAIMLPTNRKVMVIYGQDTEANTALFDWLRAIGLQPLEWSQLVHASGSGSPFIGEVLEKALQDVQAVVAFFTPDEYVTPAGSNDPGTGRFQARPNVLIEAGMAFITHPTRTIIAVLGTQELPSDLAGRHHIRLNHTNPAPLHELATRLQGAGCDTDTTGSHWLDPARFPARDTPSRPTDPRPITVAPSPAEGRVRKDTQSDQDARCTREDTDARQVAVTIEPKPNPDYTHMITISSPLTYPIKWVDGQIAWQTNGGMGMTGFGFAGDPPRADDHRRRYTFRAKVSPQIRNPEPIIRFVDLHGNLYYQFRDHTQRFPPNTDWTTAAAAIDQWLRTGPKPD